MMEVVDAGSSCHILGSPGEALGDVLEEEELLVEG